MDSSLDLARFNMIQQQIRPWGVLDDRVLDVMGEVRRESFVPGAYMGLAYADLEVPLDAGQAMLTPKVVGRMLQALAVQPGDRVLEVGTGSGYVTACLTRLGGRVATVEIQPQLAAAARERLTRLGFDPVEVREGDALAEPSPGGPFDVIAVTGSVPGSESLSLLEDQLAPGGRLFCIIGVPPIMEAWLVTRVVGHEFRREALFETCAPTLANCTEPQGFVF